MAPQYKREETYHLVFNWIFGRPLWTSIFILIYILCIKFIITQFI
jgi:hypothetical protein